MKMCTAILFWNAAKGFCNMECSIETKDYTFHIGKFGASLIFVYFFDRFGAYSESDNLILRYNKKVMQQLHEYVVSQKEQYFKHDRYSYYHITDCLNMMLMLMKEKEIAEIRFF